jgi:hypothetical protein
MSVDAGQRVQSEGGHLLQQMNAQNVLPRVAASRRERVVNIGRPRRRCFTDCWTWLSAAVPHHSPRACDTSTCVVAAAVWGNTGIALPLIIV